MGLQDCIGEIARRLEREAGGAPLTGEPQRHILSWLELLRTWNARIDLTAARTDEEIADVMLADALILAGRIPRGAEIVDVGTGAGAPGLALALMRPDLKATLVEPLSKRTAFLRTVLGTVGRADVRLERAKGEDIVTRVEGRPGRAAYDIAMARATLAPPAWLELGARLVKDGGSVWVLLAKEGAPERAGARVVEDVAYAWPNSGNARRAVRYAVGYTAAPDAPDAPDEPTQAPGML